ncbi:MAG: alpha/beta hydrolase-fold protein [Caldimonas sp.]
MTPGVSVGGADNRNVQTMTVAIFSAGRRASLLAILGAIAGCGGGGSGSADTPMAGSLQTRTIAAAANGTNYPLNVYLPPDPQLDRASLPVVYLLDGESRMGAVVSIIEAMRARVIVIGIGNEAQRSRDYVPVNQCTLAGGGEGAYLDFIRFELIPFVETTFGGSAQKRVLLGHSHGGSFVLYALFAEANATRHFSSYLASDASIDCMRATVYAWESDYATTTKVLPVRLHVSYAGNLANAAFGTQLEGRGYTGLRLAVTQYGGGHIGMIPAAFSDALTFALAA